MASKLPAKDLPRLTLARPSESALSLASEIGEGHKGNCPVRSCFVRRSEPGSPTPLAQLMGSGQGQNRGGQGGGVRLKVLLTLLWVCGGKSSSGFHELSRRDRAYSILFDLDRNGVRRIGRALHWLHDNHFVQLVDDAELSSGRKRRSTMIRLLREDGSQTDYHRPNPTTKSEDGVTKPEELYFDLPRSLWTNG